MKSPFAKFGRQRLDKDNLNDPMRPWWAWGPLGLIWFGSTHDSTATSSGIDATHGVNPGDAGGFHQNIDHGGFGGFDGGAGGGGF